MQFAPQTVLTRSRQHKETSEHACNKAVVMWLFGAADLREGPHRLQGVLQGPGEDG